MCRTEEKYRYAKNVMPVLRTIPRSPDRRYDAAVFYTGGKDSSYLLYQLARVQKLRVLSLTWETPFISDWARAVSYTHLDVYKRQWLHSSKAARTALIGRKRLVQLFL